MPPQIFSLKIHKTYRKIVAMCDVELLGKKFEDDKLQLDVNEVFYGGKESKKVNEIEAIKILKKEALDDACFNFVGKKAIEIAIKSGIIDKNATITIQGIPHALALL